jgi:hypothetical protein
VRIRKKTVTEDHPGRLNSEEILADVYKHNGQIERAVRIQEHIVRIRKKTLTEEHPDRLRSEEYLADIYRQDGQI